MKDPALKERLEHVLAPGFVLEDEVGRGGMGIVYRAKDVRLKRTVAVKLLPPELAYRDEIRSRFLREAEMAAQLSHPNIVPIYTVDEKENLVYFIMAFIDGETLGARITARGRLAVSEARTILRQVADALAYAHARGVIHRDIKPDNILIALDDGRAVVTDFGIARAADDTTGTKLTATGVAIGTPAYMSPEQCTGERAVDGRSDLYSLGVVMYYALAGTPPFAGTNTAALLVKHLTERPRPLRDVRGDVPADLAAIIMRLLEKNPGDRFQDAQAVVQALDAPAGSPPPAAPTPPPPPMTNVAATLQNAARLRELAATIEKPVRLRDRTDPEGLELRVNRFRRATVSWLGFNAVMATINVMAGIHHMGDIRFPWVTIWWGFGLVRSAGSLWADGVNPVAMLRGGHLGLRGKLPSGQRVASRLVAPEVLAGPYGPAVRRATGDHAAVLDHIDRLKTITPKGGAIPDVLPTADALVDQIASLATALHRIDVETPETQRSQLAVPRQELLGQMERASLALQNLALDLLRLRSAGVDAGIGTVTSATEQAKALSKEIGYALSAADELRAQK